MSNSRATEKLFTAICERDMTSVLAALNDGADLNAEKKKFIYRTPLAEAVSFKRLEIAELLIMRGAELNARITHVNPTHNTSHQTALCRSHSAECTRLLIQHKADPNPPLFGCEDRSPLWYTVFRPSGCSIENIKVLLEAKADVQREFGNPKATINGFKQRAFFFSMRDHEIETVVDTLTEGLLNQAVRELSEPRPDAPTDRICP